MAQVLQDVADMAIDFKRSHGYSLQTFGIQYVSSTNSSSSYRSQQTTYKRHTTTINSIRKTQMLALPGRTLQKGLLHSPEAKFPPQNANPQRKNSIT